MLEYTAKQVAEKFQVHIVTIYKWAEKGILPGKKLGKRLWRFDKNIVESYGLRCLPVETVTFDEHKEAKKGRDLVLPI